MIDWFCMYNFCSTKLKNHILCPGLMPNGCIKSPNWLEQTLLMSNSSSLILNHFFVGRPTSTSPYFSHKRISVEHTSSYVEGAHLIDGNHDAQIRHPFRGSIIESAGCRPRNCPSGDAKHPLKRDYHLNHQNRPTGAKVRPSPSQRRKVRLHCL